MKNEGAGKLLSLPDPVRRLNANLPESQLNRFKALAKKHGTSMTSLIRDGLGLLEYVAGAMQNGRRIIVMDARGKIEKEILLPTYSLGPQLAPQDGHPEEISAESLRFAREHNVGSG